MVRGKENFISLVIDEYKDKHFVLKENDALQMQLRIVLYIMLEHVKVVSAQLIQSNQSLQLGVKNK